MRVVLVELPLQDSCTRIKSVKHISVLLPSCSAGQRQGCKLRLQAVFSALACCAAYCKSAGSGGASRGAAEGPAPEAIINQLTKLP